MRKLKSVFSLAVLAGVTAVVTYAVLTKPVQHSVVTYALTSDVWVTGQISLDDLSEFKSQGIKAIVDLRPDGEAPDQPSAVTVRQSAEKKGLQFAYAPVPHGDIPAASVDALSQSLVQARKPVLLYCRSGGRAARTWALVEASRPGGMDSASVQAAVRSAGLSADDLGDLIAARIAARPPVN